MVEFALLGFAFGVLATAATLLILMPINLRTMRAGGLVKSVAIGAFVAPLVGLFLLSGGEPPASSDAVPLGDMSQWNSSEPWSLPSHMAPGSNSTGPGNWAATPGSKRAGHSIEELRAMANDSPDDARIWFALANAQRQARDFAAAVTSFEKALRIDSKNADAWADYADALASAGDRRLSGAPAAAIARALQIDERHPKALWLQASLDLEQHKYAAALEHWQALRAALPEGSPDTSIVEANIAEARQLISQGAAGG